MTKITMNSYTTEATTIEQQLLDVREYADANAKRFDLDLVAGMTDQALIEAMGTRKNSRAAILAVYVAIKPMADARRAAAAEPTPAPEPVVVIDPKGVGDAAPAAVKRAKKAVQARARRAAKKAAKAA